MEARVKRLRALGARIASEQDAWLRAHPGATEAARDRFLANDPARLFLARPSRAALWGALAAAAATTLAVGLWRSERAALEFEIGPSEGEIAGPRRDPSRGTVGEWIAAPSHAPLPLRFSDGSVVRLGSGARARVAEVTPQGARVVLEQGTATARVVHRSETRWEIKAGPFEVRVVGTTFEVRWDPARDLFTLSLEQGRVAVRGCALSHERVVTTGETFRATCREGRVVPDAPPPLQVGSMASASARGESATDPGPTATGSSAIEADDGVSTSAAPRLRASAWSGPPNSQWQDLADHGRYEEAIDSAEAVGLPALCDRADVATLMKLGDAARFAARPTSAALVLRRLRERFPGDDRASVAAFHLGTMAFDRSAYGEAFGWFEAYLKERPAGPLAREASGRIVEALEDSGDHVRARDAAKHYLDHFPSGPHAEFARSAMSR